MASSFVRAEVRPLDAEEGMILLEESTMKWLKRKNGQWIDLIDLNREEETSALPALVAAAEAAKDDAEAAQAAAEAAKDDAETAQAAAEAAVEREAANVPAIAAPGAADAEEVANKVNDLIAALVAAGLMEAP